MINKPTLKKIIIGAVITPIVGVMSKNIYTNITSKAEVHIIDFSPMTPARDLMDPSNVYSEVLSSYVNHTEQLTLKVHNKGNDPAIDCKVMLGDAFKPLKKGDPALIVDNTLKLKNIDFHDASAPFGLEINDSKDVMINSPIHFEPGAGNLTVRVICKNCVSESRDINYTVAKSRLTTKISQERLREMMHQLQVNPSLLNNLK